MRSLKKRGPHVLDDLNDLLFSLQVYQMHYALRVVGHGLSLEHVLSELHKNTFINRMIFTDCY